MHLKQTKQLQVTNESIPIIIFNLCNVTSHYLACTLPYFKIIFSATRQMFALHEWVNLFITESNQYSFMNACFACLCGQISLENNPTNISLSKNIANKK